MRKWALLAVLVVAAVWTFRAAQTHRHHLSLLPPALGVSHVLSAVERSWGAGPGGNETGVIVYRMPDALRQALDGGGLPWLRGLAGSPDWHETPFAADAAPGETCGPGGLSFYLGRFGHCIDIDPATLALIDPALTTPGGFWATAPGGRLILLIPDRGRIVVAYSG